MNKFKYFIPSIIIMIVIFCLSHQNGNSSSDTSLGVLAFIQQFIPFKLEGFIIRKFAHVSEYAVLYLSFFYAFYHTADKPYIYSMIYSFIYALSDEFHQVFIDGRCGSLIDVGIDSIGMAVMAVLIYIVMKMTKRNA